MTRCAKCNKRLGLTEFICKCGGKFCITHLHSAEHGCTYDYHSNNIKILEKNNPKCESNKIDNKI